MKTMFHRGLFHLSFWKNLTKVQISLINHVYDQLLIGLLASLLCASLVFISLHDMPDQKLANTWFGFFIVVTLTRFGFYKLKTDKIITDPRYLTTLYTLGAVLGGLSWGLLGGFLLPHATTMQQVLMILILAGVTAGAVPLSAGIPIASVLFLILSIIPFIVSIAKLPHSIFIIFDFALSIYLIYSVTLTMKLYNLIRNSITLQFENDSLLNDLAKSNEKLVFASTHDTLTNLPNRRFFEQRFELLFQRAKKNKHFALFFIDLDHFKEANDFYGHSAGDCILITISARLSRKFDQQKIIARLGGDELAMIVDPVIDTEQLVGIAKEICHLVAKPIAYGDRTLHVTASIGISIYPEDGNDPDELLINADNRMYMVKRQGGNNYYLPKELTVSS